MGQSTNRILGEALNLVGRNKPTRKRTETTGRKTHFYAASPKDDIQSKSFEKDPTKIRCNYSHPIDAETETPKS